MSQSYLITILWILIFTIIFSLIFQNNLSIIEIVLNLITVTFCSCIIITNFSSFSFYSFIVFLIIIGGLIILFIIFLSLISNQYVNFNSKKILKAIIYTLILFSFLKFISSINLINNLYTNRLNWLIYYSSSFINLQYAFNIININQIYNYPTNIIFILLIFFLLLILILITKICLKNNKPLRSTKKS